VLFEGIVSYLTILFHVYKSHNIETEDTKDKILNEKVVAYRKVTSLNSLEGSHKLVQSENPI
jgi:hypothetical protein